MPDNLIPTATTEPAGPGATLRLMSLAPHFSEKRHRTYFDLLTRALAYEDVTSVALTGAYGAGKSSVLDKLRSAPEYENRVVRLSLSTIAPKPTPSASSAANDADPAPSSRVNQIQKEIVKQLLYTTLPEQVPQSRYRRTSVPVQRRNNVIALVSGLVVWLALVALGPLHPIITTAFEGFWRHVLAYFISALLVFGLTWLIVSIIRSRPTVSASVTAAMTTITLSKQADTYFDDYLDEIVYVFQVTQRDIVVIEDIDRFEDVEILDTLRALNNLLNTSQQIEKRITFIYAIRDSVFEQVGNVDQYPDTVVSSNRDHAKQALKRASRTKFFDVIIPIVPFVSADNARDLMSNSMKSDQFKIAPALIRLAARHVADMRLIHNIRNEFEIYRNQLVATSNRIPGISDDLVFAIVLYKNTHLEDFELIRHKDSSLDRLYRAWRKLVTTNLTESAGPSLAEFRASEEVESRREARAKLLSKRLTVVREDLEAAAPSSTSVNLPPDLGPLEIPDTWAQIVADGGLKFEFVDRRGATSAWAFNVERLTRLLGTSIDPDEWELLDSERVGGDRAKLEAEVSFLRHHTWKELSGRTDLTVPIAALDLTDEEKARLLHEPSADPSGAPGELNFATLISVVLSSELARDLVRHGYLTPHFASYASSYYGKHLGPRARDYIYRFVDPGEAEATFELSKKDVGQLLREQGADTDDGADIFSDPSILNVNIVDYLLEQRPGAAATVTKWLASAERQRESFLGVYMTQGRNPAALLALMSKDWPAVVSYAATSNAVPESNRVAIVNTILKNMPHANFDVGGDVGQLLAARYREMDAFTTPASTERASVVFGTLRASGVTIEDLTPLNATARSVAIEMKLFPITETNLRVIIPEGRIGLDTLLSNKAAYEHTHAHLGAFLTLVETQPTNYRTVVSPKEITAVLKDVQPTDPKLLLRLVSGAPSDALVTSLSAVPAKVWPALATSRRVLATFGNVEAYITEYKVDAHLKALLADRRIFEADEADLEARRAMAYVILEASEAIPSTLARVKIATSLRPGVLELGRITPESGDFPARLLVAKLLVDDADVFSSPLMLDWPTMEKSIKASKSFRTFVSPSVLRVAWVPDFLRSSLVSPEKHRALVSNLQAFLAAGSRADARAIASALISERWRIPPSSMLELYTAGATAKQVVHLVSWHGEEMTAEAISTVFRALGGDYARVATGGRGRPHFPNDAAHQVALNRFVGGTVREVEMMKFKLWGIRLVAHLK